jgi:GDPmannose 4,6-dehydratase
MSKKAFITGIGGQDGSYLAEFLLKKNYIVHGIKRRSSLINTSRIDHIYQDPHSKKKKLIIHYGDLSDSSNLNSLINKILPDEIYNLAAQSHVKVSYELPEYTSNINGLGVLRILECIKNLKNKKYIKFYQASTSELFGGSSEKSYNENSQFLPKSPYAVAKLYAHWITAVYRDSYKIFACNGILFNHESPRRGETFVTKKIINGLKEIMIGKSNCLYLGNINAIRDWGHAKDYVEMMWKMLQKKNATDYVISTGIERSVRDFIEKCSEQLGFKIQWKGTGTKEVGFVKKIYNKNLKIRKNKIIVRIDKRYFRPLEVNFLKGNSKKARKELSWKPKYNLNQLVSSMLKND